MRKIFLVPVFILMFVSANAQPSTTEIYLVNISYKEGIPVFSVPINITNHEGYDNQPEFTPDSKQILYVSMPDTTQSDIFQYTISDSSTVQLTQTMESEYSPRFMPDRKSITMVRVNQKKAQRLCLYDAGFTEAEELLQGLDSIAYYTWINDSTIALACLHNGLELVLFEYYYGQFVVADKNIGRCLMKLPDSNTLVYTRKEGSNVNLYSFVPGAERAELFCNGLADIEDYAITPDGRILAGKDGKLYMSNLVTDNTWKEVADFSKSCGSFYRMAVSPDGKRLALVSYKGKKP